MEFHDNSCGEECTWDLMRIFGEIEKDSRILG